jgi:hypothetical protein
MRSRKLCDAALAVVVAGLVAACHQPAVPHRLTGQSRFLCCNVHYEHDEINDANYQVGTLIPFGTHVDILEVRKDKVKFAATGFPPLWLELQYGDKLLSFDQYLDRIFLEQDPHLKLKKVPAKTVKLIEAAAVDPGMTKDQVLMSIGWPPAHRTPSTEASDWHYWRNRWAQFDVYFDDKGRVVRVN